MVRDTDAFVGLGNKLVANADKAQANDLITKMNVASLSGHHSIIWNKSGISVGVINTLSEEDISVSKRPGGGYVIDWQEALEMEE
ncbi:MULTISPECIES: hypothetical protein [Bacilli]|nr:MULTISPECIES: hypothetical protein [Bacilli]AGL64423.2 hypothetical protein LBP_cg1677 [Lactiplantibacillus plantarum subsp. plantarum P-8]MBR0604386.1 hypothetical protein [Bacillus safensis]MBR7568926.1 hypothetical protein [Lactiplantibacillus plantarum]MBR7623495.1 hypothetical protein [Lactiplantibacillus plantarum]MBR7625856.1 hypothetical protein [Lactiplantibacillus plantarum]